MVALAKMVHQVLKAREALEREGISVELIDPRTIAPLDFETIHESVRKTGRLLIVDEDFAPFGVGAEIAARMADVGFDDLDAPIRRINGLHTPTPYSPPLEGPSSPTSRRSPAPSATSSGSKTDAMAIAITIPRLGWNMEEGVFVGWLKRDGETIRVGDPIFTLEGEKATQDIEASDAGILRIPATTPGPGATVPVGAVIGYVLAPGEADPADPSSPPENGVEHRSPVEAMAVASPPAPTIEAGAEAHVHNRRDRPRISPLARRLARELGVDWTQLHGSGCTGRIRKVDVLAAAQPSSRSGTFRGTASRRRRRHRARPSRSGRPAGRSPLGWSRAVARRRRSP